MKSADDQEVTDKAGFFDDCQLEFQPVHDDFDGGGDFRVVDSVGADVRRL